MRIAAAFFTVVLQQAWVTPVHAVHGRFLRQSKGGFCADVCDEMKDMAGAKATCKWEEDNCAGCTFCSTPAPPKASTTTSTTAAPQPGQPPPAATITTTTKAAEPSCHGWATYAGNCYASHSISSDYVSAKIWCKEQDADLVSIHSPEENQFVWSICKERSCWLGLTEKEIKGLGGRMKQTGNATSLQSQQQWTWADKTDLAGYSNWKEWGGPNDEPNNWADGKAFSYDERFAFMNFPSGGNKGKWYDASQHHQAHAICKRKQVSFPPPVAPTAHCNEGWQGYGGKCYIVNEEESDWKTAQHWCAESQADLVSIHSAAENEQARLACGKRMCWLGLSEKKGTGTKNTARQWQEWVWNDGSSLKTYTNWKQWPAWQNGRYTKANYEPNNWGNGKANGHDERRAYMNWPGAGYGGSWYDADASMMGHAMCQMDMNYHLEPEPV